MPLNQILVRTDTGHCIPQTIMAVPMEDGNPVQQEQRLDVASAAENNVVKSPASATSERTIVLTISPTPIASTVQVRADIVEITTQATETVVQGESSDGNAPEIVPAAPLSASSEHLPSPLVTKKSTSHTFIYRWFHHNDNDEPGMPSSTKTRSEDSLHSASSDAAPSRKHTLIYRLFHQHDIYMEKRSDTAPAAENGSAESSAPASTEPTPAESPTSPSNANDEHKHHDNEKNCVCAQDETPGTPQTHRRHALLQKLFHHAHTSATNTDDDRSDHSESTPASPSPFSFMSLRKKHHDSDTVPGGSNHASADNLSESAVEERKAHRRGHAFRRSADGAGELHLHHDVARRSTKKLSPRSSMQNIAESGELNATGSRNQLKSSESTELRKGFNMFRHLLLPPKHRPSLVSSPAPSTPDLTTANPSEANTAAPSPSAHHEMTLEEKYGHAEKVIGKGAGGVVRLFHKSGFTGPHDKLYAVKVCSSICLRCRTHFGL